MKKKITSNIHIYIIIIYEWKTAVFNSPSPSPSQAPSPSVSASAPWPRDRPPRPAAWPSAEGSEPPGPPKPRNRPRRRGGSFTVKGRSWAEKLWENDGKTMKHMDGADLSLVVDSWNPRTYIYIIIYIWGLSKIPFPGQPSIAQPIA